MMRNGVRTPTVRKFWLLSLIGLLTIGPFPSAAGAPPRVNKDDALVILSTRDTGSFHQVLALVRGKGGETPQAFHPNAFVAYLTPAADQALRSHRAVTRIERGVVSPASLRALGGQAEVAAHIWNTVFRGVPDPIAAASPRLAVPPWHKGPDFLIPPPEAPGVRTRADAPTSTQTSEFMAGTVVYSVVFVESSSTAGNCSPPDTQTEDWSAARQTTVLTEIADGMAFWTSRASRPSPLTFVLDNLGSRPTSCEPINRPSGDRGLWIADVLTALGLSATPGTHLADTRSLANSRRNALGADWGFLIFVVDSFNDVDGQFPDGRSAFAYLNGPYMVMTYDNGGWGIDRMNLVAAHETGHIFGSLDEYASSECSTADTWGYHNVANTSCNNGGITTDVSIMGEGSEMTNPAVDVSTSARGAIGWRNFSGGLVDVVRTATASITAHAPDPTPDETPTYQATAGNTPWPPDPGCNTWKGICYRYPTAVTISRVASASWNVDGGAFLSAGVIPSDGAFDNESDAYTFTPPTVIPGGPRTFGTRSTNNFGHTSTTATDVLTIVPGSYTAGLYRGTISTFYLRNSNTAGVADLTFGYGPAGAGWTPIAGDWNGNGIVTVGLYNPAASVFYLRNSNTAGVADLTFGYGPAGAGWIPLVGDWNGDGIVTVGLYNPVTSVFYLRNSNTAGVADLTFGYGPAGAGWIPIVGDWNGDGVDTVGLYNPATSVFYLRNSNTAGVADLTFGYGPAGAGWVPAAGDWDGNGTDTVGLYNPATSVFYLRNSNTAGVADLTFGYGPAGAGWVPRVGDWDGL